ncbi:MAG TPA: lipoyl(octanoyl) transferase LipB [Candidatus Limnocylindrales bacterium]|nr:lipoyl(octanoyl) transferase LipB [Candidatus Limnocylindrales bacterium]
MEATLSRGYAFGPNTDAGADADAAAPAATDAPALGSHWLGRVPYRRAWELQRRLAAARADGRIDDQLLLLEHPAVLTLGRAADEDHVRAPAAELARRGIEVLRVERGGEVTYHGPGQLVAYPILALSRRSLLLRPLVRALEAALADTCATFGVDAGRREGQPGCWCDPEGARPRKIGALGLRVERGVTYHGIALNVSVDLADFELIDACGLPGTISTSIDRELGRVSEPSTAAVREAAIAFDRALRAALGMATADVPVGLDDPRSALSTLERLATG